MRKRAVEANLAMIRHVATRLGHLRDRVVFLGGAATALLVTDSGAPDVRVTIDVDVIVEIASRGDYYRLAILCAARAFLRTSLRGRQSAGGLSMESPLMSCLPKRKFWASATVCTKMRCYMPQRCWLPVIWPSA